MLTIRLTKPTESATLARSNSSQLVRQASQNPLLGPKESGHVGSKHYQGNVIASSGDEKPAPAIAKGAGYVGEIAGLDIVGHRVIRSTGNKVHFCSRCDFPISVYGRLETCHHAFCLTCAQSSRKCFLCGKDAGRVHRVDCRDGLFICGAPGCLVSFPFRASLQTHIRERHSEFAVKVPTAPQASSKQPQQLPKSGSTSSGVGVQKPARPPEAAALDHPPQRPVSSRGPVAADDSTLDTGGAAAPGQRPPKQQQQMPPGDPYRASVRPHPSEAFPDSFPDPRVHPPGHPDFFRRGPPGHMMGPGPMGPPGGHPDAFMGMGGPPGPLRPPFGKFSPMGPPMPFMDHPPPFHDGPFPSGRPHKRGRFPPGGPEEGPMEHGFGWVGGGPGAWPPP